MISCVSRLASAVVVTFALASVFLHADDVRRQSSPPPVAVEASLKTGGGAFYVKAQGSCTHAAEASIYDVPSQMWMVSYEDGGRSMQLMLWKPADGSAHMFSLSVNGKKNSTVSTVRGGEVSGSGTVTLAPAGKGGTFTIQAKERTGDAISGTITCGAFTPAIAEGGE